MELNRILEGIRHTVLRGDDRLEIRGIAYDSRKVQDGDLFVCIDGIDEDGHRYLPHAMKNGAVCAIVANDPGLTGITLIMTDDTRWALARSSANFYGHPSGRLNLMGITGTKGKTTTSYMVKSIFDRAGRSCGMSGTLGIYLGNRYIASKITTPQSLDLQRLYHDAIQEGIRDIVMEVSSIALKQKRVACSDYEIGMFTNISRAHIGKREHDDFTDYLGSKAILFSQCKKGIVNIDDPHSCTILSRASCDILTLSARKPAEIKAEDISFCGSTSRFTYRGLGHILDVALEMPGEFNVYNALFAITCGLLSGVAPEAVIQGIHHVKVPGRCEMVYQDRYSIMIDYAHTPDSLEKLLLGMKESAERLVCIFGCGGDRDNAMRSMMGKISGTHANISILTSDNPRTEDPERIIDMIEEGIRPTGGEYLRIADRTEAIRYAIRHARKGDLVILAGKGHETYIEKNGERTHYDEREVVRNILMEGGVVPDADGYP